MRQQFMLQKLYKQVMPDICCMCDTKGMTDLDLCQNCHKSLPHNLQSCFRCAIPLGTTWQQSDSQTICGRCLNQPDAIDQAIIPFLYRPPVDHMIKRLKFSGDTKFSRLLGELLADAVSANNHSTAPDVLLPVPIHHQRLMHRGFNQAEMIAHTTGQRLGIAVDCKAINRSALQLPQAGLSARKREDNIRRAFEVNRSNVEGLNVAIVDDVYTTGATARSIARQLNKARARKISIWAVARTP